MVDEALLARKISAVRDAVARIREVLPAEAEQFFADRTRREIVALNLLVAIQECLSMATHWLADAGRTVPRSYGEVFDSLADHGVLERTRAARLASAAELREVIAHQYVQLDWKRVRVTATEGLDDPIEFCEALAVLAKRAGG